MDRYRGFRLVLMLHDMFLTFFSESLMLHIRLLFRVMPRLAAWQLPRRLPRFSIWAIIRFHVVSRGMMQDFRALGQLRCGDI